MINQRLATHHDFSDQNILKQFSLTRVQKCTQALSEIRYTRTLASVIIGA